MDLKHENSDILKAKFITKHLPIVSQWIQWNGTRKCHLPSACMSAKNTRVTKIRAASACPITDATLFCYLYQYSATRPKILNTVLTAHGIE